jgi:hypothetical protein
MISEYPNVLIEMGASAIGLPPRLEIVDHVSSGYHGARSSSPSTARPARHTEGTTMPKHDIFAIAFAKVYPLYVQKAERKNRTKAEVDQIICWLTGYEQAGLQQQIKKGNDLKTFLAQAPAIHPNSSLIKGVVCGIRVEDIEDPLMQNIRYLDRLIDELAKGKSMEKILRQ